MKLVRKEKYVLPVIGGPIKQATPSNNNSSPKAFVNLSNPKRSTKITDVRLT